MTQATNLTSFNAYQIASGYRAIFLGAKKDNLLKRELKPSQNFQEQVLFIQDLLEKILGFSTPTEVKNMTLTCRTIARVPNMDYIRENALINLFFRDRVILPKDWENFRKKDASVSLGTKPEPVVTPVPLPNNIRQELLKPSPYFPRKIIAQTTYILFEPDLVNGERLTYNSFKPLMENPTNGPPSPCRGIEASVVLDHGNTPLRALGQSGYVLITEDVILSSRDKNYLTQQAFIKIQGGDEYKPPSFLEMVVLIAAVYNKTGKHLYTNNPWTYTRCQEGSIVLGNATQVIVGGFNPVARGLRSRYNYFDDKNVGVAARRELKDRPKS